MTPSTYTATQKAAIIAQANAYAATNRPGSIRAAVRRIPAAVARAVTRTAPKAAPARPAPPQPTAAEKAEAAKFAAMPLRDFEAHCQTLLARIEKVRTANGHSWREEAANGVRILEGIHAPKPKNTATDNSKLALRAELNDRKNRLDRHVAAMRNADNPQRYYNEHGADMKALQTRCAQLDSQLRH